MPDAPITPNGRPTVAVVGGGYGGINVAKALDEEADVVLIDPKEAFAHNVAALRALVDTSWLGRTFYPFERLLQHGRFVRDRAVAVDSKHVVLESGEEIAADYIVLASGSTYPFPAKSDTTELTATFARYEAAHDVLASVERVLLLGAGPVGLELAGEIVSAWPEKRVTIVDVAPDILGGPFKPELRAELRRQLDERGVELVLGSRLEGEPPTSPGVAGTFTVRTERGDEITADLWYRCYGVAPVTGYLTGDLAASRTSDGFIATSQTLQVPGHDHVFAIGDASSIDAKMAGRASLQAAVVAGNIRALASGSGELADYEPLPPVILVPLGPGGGAGQLPGADEIAGPDVATAIKGEHLLVEHYAGLFAGLEAESTF